MRDKSDHPTPVGVVPRRQVRTIEPLMSDAPGTAQACSVAASVEESRPPAAVWARWLPPMAVFTALAGALEWLKLTR